MPRNPNVIEWRIIRLTDEMYDFYAFPTGIQYLWATTFLTMPPSHKALTEQEAEAA